MQVSATRSRECAEATVRRSAATGALVATPVSEDVRLGNVSLRRVGTDAEVDDFFEEVEEAKKRRNWPETVCELRDLGCAAPGCRNQVHITVPSFATGSSTGGTRFTASVRR